MVDSVGRFLETKCVGLWVRQGGMKGQGILFFTQQDRVFVFFFTQGSKLKSGKVEKHVFSVVFFWDGR